MATRRRVRITLAARILTTQGASTQFGQMRRSVNTCKTRAEFDYLFCEANLRQASTNRVQTLAHARQYGPSSLCNLVSKGLLIGFGANSDVLRSQVVIKEGVKWP